MMFKLVTVILIVYVVKDGSCQSFLSEMDTRHLQICYNGTDIYSPNYHRPPQSLDNLLAIIEKIEQHPFFTGKDMKNIALYVLNRYRFDGIYKKPWERGVKYPTDINDYLNYDRTMQELQKLQWSILSQTNEYLTYPVNFLSKKEKCALHWMLSRGFNETRRDEESRTDFIPPPDVGDPQPMPSDNNYDSRYPLENGVIDSNYGTVAPAYVLAGIATAFDTSGLSNRVSDFIAKSIFLPAEIASLQFDIRYGCLASLARAADGDIPTGKSKLGPGGWWNCTYCPNQFTLIRGHNFATDAEIFGSVDGFLIAKRLKDTPITTSGQGKLSQVLRMYYNRGIFGELRACNRMILLSQEIAKEDFIPNMARFILIQAYNTIGKSKDITSAERKANQLVTDLKTNYTNNQKFRCEDQVDEQEIIPTVDLYVVLESSLLLDEIKRFEVAGILGQLENFLDIAPTASHIGLYLNDPELFDQLLPMNRSASEASMKCKAKWLNTDQLPYSPKPNNLETIRKLKELLNKEKFSEENRKNITTPGKVVLFILFSRGNQRVEDLRWQMSLLRKDHPEVEFLLTGSNAEADIYVRDTRRDFISYNPDQVHAVTSRGIYERLKRVGSNIHAPECADVDNGRTNTIVVSSYLANNTIQFHTINANMFNLSKSLKIEAKGSSYPLKICISRSDDIFNNNFRGYCEKFPINAPAKIIYSGKPCDSVYCNPIHLRVQTYFDDPVSTNRFTILCQNRQDCRTLDQIPYKISITGAYCGSSVAKIAVGLIALSVFISSFFNGRFE